MRDIASLVHERLIDLEMELQRHLGRNHEGGPHVKQLMLSRGCFRVMFDQYESQQSMRYATQPRPDLEKDGLPWGLSFYVASGKIDIIKDPVLK